MDAHVRRQRRSGRSADRSEPSSGARFPWCRSPSIALTRVEIERTLSLPGPPERLFELVEDLARYPRWMQLVHQVVELEPDPDGRPAWDVELRAQVGPLARSKRLRMVRTVHDAPWSVEFERAEVDGRAHAPWLMRADLEPIVDTAVNTADGIVLTMRLSYGGGLWTGAVLQRVLDDGVRRGSEALLQIVSSEPTH